MWKLYSLTTKMQRKLLQEIFSAIFPLHSFDVCVIFPTYATMQERDMHSYTIKGNILHEGRNGALQIQSYNMSARGGYT